MTERKRAADRRKNIFLFHAREGLEAAFDARFMELAKSDKRKDHRWAVLLGQNEMQRVPHHMVMSGSPPPARAYLEKPDEDNASLNERIAALSDLADKGRSLVVTTEEFEITTGDGPVFVAMILRRLPALDRADFMNFWFHRHASLGEAIDGIHYRQNHIRDNESSALMLHHSFTAPAIDGIALSYFPDTGKAHSMLSMPSIAVEAIADEMHFIDHARSQFGIYRTISSAR